MPARSVLILFVVSGATAVPAAEPAPGPLPARYRDGHGFLRDVLAAYDIDPNSQTLVFSKTSLQKSLITPYNPRAVYFNDDVYVGFVPGGDRLEVMTTSKRGAKFFTIDQVPGDAAVVTRQSMLCTACHESPRTGGVPGFLTQSLAVDASGKRLASSHPDSFYSGRVDHTTPLSERWGGWYAMGYHGDAEHLGNGFVTERAGFTSGHGGPRQNEDDLTWWLDPGDYAGGSADLVALLIFEHQLTAHNLMTRAAFATRAAFRGPGTEDAKRARIDRAVRPLLEYMLFVGEAPLSDPVSGTTNFTDAFTARGPFDEHGRTLRAFDLETRMMRHRLSYLVHSRGFAELPRATRESFGRQLAAVLEGSDPEYGDHHAADERVVIGAILRATEPGLLPD